MMNETILTNIQSPIFVVSQDIPTESITFRHCGIDKLVLRNHVKSCCIYDSQIKHLVLPPDIEVVCARDCGIEVIESTGTLNNINMLHLEYNHLTQFNLDIGYDATLDIDLSYNQIEEFEYQSSGLVGIILTGNPVLDHDPMLSFLWASVTGL